MDDGPEAWQREWARSTTSEEQESSRGGDDGGDDSGVEGGRSRRRFSIGLLGRKIASVANDVGASIARTAAAAGELISDAELRSRSAALLAESAKKAGAGVAKGLQQGAGRIAAGPRTVQGILQKLQHKIEEQRMQALLQEQQDAPVDVQVAFQLYEDAPQELRSRLWMAVLEHPELCTEYQTLAAELQRERQQAAGAGGAAHAAAVQPGAAEPGAAAGEPGADAGASQQSEAASAALGEGHPADPSSRSIGDEAAAPAGEEEEAEHAPADLAHLASSSSGMHEPDPAHLASSYGAPWAAQHVPGGEGSMSPRGSGAERHPSQGRHSSLGRHGARGGGGGGDEDGWQLVTDQAAARRLQGAVLLAGSQEPAAYSREREGFRNILMTAMMSIPWPLPTTYPPDCRYATLLQISVGQEDVDEVISRDMHRTFPEYPLFGFEQGQQALFNVLKAYALHDMEAAYCQGMAFVAGLLLFYVPEEPAFQLFCRLLSTSGPNLRRLYLPGLEGLKAELRKLDFLLERYLPALTAHLNAAGVVPVLYASQWLLTCFSCPFPVGFACRLIDVMLQENSDAVLLKASMAILAECEGDLLMQEDFEELLTFLKVEPVQWSPGRLRRVLNAAIASPISAQDLADAEAALQQGFTGSLSRVPTFSTEPEVGTVPEGEAEAGAAEQSGEGASGSAGGEAGGSTPGRPSARHSRAGSLGWQPSAAAAALAGAGGEAGAGAAAAAGGGGEDAIAAELAAAAAAQEEELMNLVLQLDMDWGGAGDGPQDHYERTLHSVAVQGAASDGGGGASGSGSGGEPPA